MLKWIPASCPYKRPVIQTKVLKAIPDKQGKIQIHNPPRESIRNTYMFNNSLAKIFSCLLAKGTTREICFLLKLSLVIFPKVVPPYDFHCYELLQQRSATATKTFNYRDLALIITSSSITVIASALPIAQRQSLE
jgi:hypothetical protein